MKIKIILFTGLLLVLVGAVSAGTFMPTEGIFAFQVVENYTLHDINFTVPSDYKLTGQGDDFLQFKHGKDRLKITTDKGGKVKKVNSTKKVRAGKTNLGSVRGYLVDKNSTSYTFSYKEGKYLVTIKAKDLRLIMGAIGQD